MLLSARQCGVCSGRQSHRLCRVRLHRSRPAAARAGGSRSSVAHHTGGLLPSPRTRAPKRGNRKQHSSSTAGASGHSGCAAPRHASLVGVPTSRCPATCQRRSTRHNKVRRYKLIRRSSTPLPLGPGQVLLPAKQAPRLHAGTHTHCPQPLSAHSTKSLRGTVLLRPLHYVLSLSIAGKPEHLLVPGAGRVLRPQPLQHTQATAARSLSAGSRVPRAGRLLGAQPLQQT